MLDPRNGNQPTRGSGGAGVGDTLSRIVQNAQAGGAAATRASPTEPENTVTRITLYRNGFMVDNGPFRDLHSLENRRFLEALASGFVPGELQQQKGLGDGEVSIGLEDRRSEDFVPPPPPAYVAFSGEAMSLGAHYIVYTIGIVDNTFNIHNLVTVRYDRIVCVRFQ